MAAASARLRALEPEDRQAARTVGLYYMVDDAPGIRRLRHGRGFRYEGPDGRRVGRHTLARIRQIAIPPAWEDVWISPRPDGHLQATGRDARSRKQYRYHARWRTLREESKYGRMLAFGTALPRLRARVERDLSKHGLPCEKVLATLVRLLDRTHMRVGNDAYEQSNGSHGLTTLRNGHARINTRTLRFNYRAKGGKWHEVALTDPRVARIVRRCQELPGQRLVQYVDDDNTPREVGSEDVNAADALLLAVQAGPPLSPAEVRWLAPEEQALLAFLRSQAQTQ